MESNATVNIPLKDYTSVQSFSMSIPHPEKNCGMKQTICAMNPRCADPKSPNKPGWKSHTRPVFSSAVLADETGPPASRCVKRCSQRPICHQIGAKENRWIEIERPAEYQCLLKQEQVRAAKLKTLTSNPLTLAKATPSAPFLVPELDMFQTN